MATRDNPLFRLGREADLDSVYEVFLRAVEEMDRNAIPQWDTLYPTREILAEDLVKKQLYLGLIQHKIASVYVLNEECDEQYGNGAWQFPDASFRVLHRLCVDPVFQKKGVAALTMDHMEAALKSECIEALRLDVFSRNPYALRLYETRGFQRVGYADWRKGRFYLMEKRLM